MTTREPGEPIQNPEEIEDENNSEGQKPSQGFDLYETLGVPQDTSEKDKAYQVLLNKEKRNKYNEKLREKLQRAQEKFENIKKELIDIIEKCKTNYNGKTFKEKTILEVGDKKVEFEAGDNIIENFNLSDYIDLIEKYERDVELYKNHDQIEEEINSLIGQSILLSEHKNILKMLMRKVDDALESQKTKKELKNAFDAENPKSVAPETPPEATTPPAAEPEPTTEPAEPAAEAPTIEGATPKTEPSTTAAGEGDEESELGVEDYSLSDILSWLEIPGDVATSEKLDLLYKRHRTLSENYDSLNASEKKAQKYLDELLESMEGMTDEERYNKLEDMLNKETKKEPEPVSPAIEAGSTTPEPPAAAEAGDGGDEEMLQEINALRQELGIDPIESVNKIDAADRAFYELVKMYQDNEEKLNEVKEVYKAREDFDKVANDLLDSIRSASEKESFKNKKLKRGILVMKDPGIGNIGIGNNENINEYFRGLLSDAQSKIEDIKKNIDSKKDKNKNKITAINEGRSKLNELRESVEELISEINSQIEEEENGREPSALVAEPAEPAEPTGEGSREDEGGEDERKAEKRPGWFRRTIGGTGRFAKGVSVAALYGAGKLVKIWYSISVLPIILLDTWDKPEKAFDEWWKFYKKLGEKEGKKASE